MSRQNPNRSRATPAAATAWSIGAELLDRRAQPEAAAGAVLQHQEDVGCGAATRIDDGTGPPREAIDAGRRALAPVRADVDVDEPRPVQLGHAQLVGEDVHRPPVRLVVRAGEVDEVRGVDRERGDAVPGEAIPERRQLRGGRRAPAPGGGVVAEHLERGRADLGRAVGGLDHAVPSGRCAPSRRPFGSIGRRVAERSRAGCGGSGAAATGGRAVARLRAWTPTCSPASARSWTSIACGSSAGSATVPRTPRPSPRELRLPVHLVRAARGARRTRASSSPAGPARHVRRAPGPGRRSWGGRSASWSARPRASRRLRGAPGRTRASPSRTRWRASAPTPEEAKTLRAFLVDGRLVTIPAQPAKRQIVLRFLLERVFTEDRAYPEKEVNQRLALFHPDVAALRRYLVGRALRGPRGRPVPATGPRPELPGPDGPDRTVGPARALAGRRR